MSAIETDRGRLVARLLEIAFREGSLSGERLDAVGRGLAERADLIVRDGVRLARLTAERDWLLDTIAQRDEEQRWLEELLDVAERQRAGEREALQAQHQKASDAHDRLLDHHRGLLARIGTELRGVADNLRWSGEARRRLYQLAELLERELR